MTKACIDTNSARSVAGIATHAEGLNLGGFGQTPVDGFFAGQRLALEATRYWARRMLAFAEQMDALVKCADAGQILVAQRVFIERMQADYASEASRFASLLLEGGMQENDGHLKEVGVDPRVGKVRPDATGPRLRLVAKGTDAKKENCQRNNNPAPQEVSDELKRAADCVRHMSEHEVKMALLEEGVDVAALDAALEDVLDAWEEQNGQR